MNNVSASSLANLQWQYRLIVVFTSPVAVAHQQIIAWTDANRCKLNDRDVLVMNINKEASIELTDKGLTLDAAAVLTLIKQRRSTAAAYEMLLIGKDGGVKTRSTDIGDLDEFINRIDAMPMRRQEMKNDQC